VQHRLRARDERGERLPVGEIAATHSTPARAGCSRRASARTSIPSADRLVEQRLPDEPGPPGQRYRQSSTS
jgi:hypothetical protein